MAEKVAEEATADVSIPERNSIPSGGDNSVWADVSPLLESACKGRFLLALTHSLFISDDSTLFVSREKFELYALLLVFFF